MKIKTAELIGPALDWAVADVLGYAKVTDSSGLDGPVIVHKTTATQECSGRVRSDWRVFTPSTNWAQGGPIIERERITLNYDNLDGTGPCKAYYLRTLFDDQEGWRQYGPTPLVAAMRCFAASKLGDEVDVPEELL